MFSLQALATAWRLRPDVVLALHVGLLPIAAVASTLIRADLALIAIGQRNMGSNASASAGNDPTLLPRARDQLVYEVMDRAKS